MGIIVLPAESLHLWPETPAASLGLLIALTGLTNMISPLAGYYSDRCTHWLGRRRPFMIGGTVLALLGLLGMQLSSIYLYPAMYVISLLLTMTGLTTATMGHTGLLPDLLPDAVMGKAYSSPATAGKHTAPPCRTASRHAWIGAVSSVAPSPRAPHHCGSKTCGYTLLAPHTILPAPAKT